MRKDAMTKYEIIVSKEVSDIVRAFVEVEAETPEAAIALAQEIDPEEMEFQFWQCAQEQIGAIEYEAREVQ